MGKKSFVKPEDKSARARMHRQKYRNNTGSGLYVKRKWEFDEEDMILDSEYSDLELSVILHRSVTAIQKKRWELKHGRYV